MPDTSPSSADLLRWYDAHARILPWRSPPGAPLADPYHVWLSEIMLQQTTVKAVQPYFLNFLKRWPQVEDLANAPLDDVLAAWAGLGYYARARNLHKCAKVVAEDLGGQFPKTEAALLTLPGIGPYTAAAIASIAFGQQAVVVDGNVERVMARIYAIRTPLPAAKAEMKARAAALTPKKRPGDYAQAVMDLGATICTPKSPACALCPWEKACAARKLGIAAELPARAPKAEKPTRRGIAFFVRDKNGHILLRTRPEKGLLAKMTEVPGSPWEDNSGFEDVSGAPIKANWQVLEGDVRHTFTHFHLELKVHVARVNNAAPTVCNRSFWVDEQELGAQALPSVMRKIIKKAVADGH